MPADIVIKRHRDRAILIGGTPEGKLWLFENIKDALPEYTVNISGELVDQEYVENLVKQGLTVEE